MKPGTPIKILVSGVFDKDEIVLVEHHRNQNILVLNVSRTRWCDLKEKDEDVIWEKSPTIISVKK